MPKNKTKHAPSAYAQFVKANYPATRALHTRAQDRIKYIAALWRKRGKIK